MSKFIAKYSHADVDIINREVSFSSFLRVDKLQLRHQLFGGGSSDVILRELIVRVNAVGVLLFDPDRDEVVLVRQFRVGALNEKSSPWMLEPTTPNDFYALAKKRYKCKDYQEGETT